MLKYASLRVPGIDVDRLTLRVEVIVNDTASDDGELCRMVRRG